MKRWNIVEKHSVHKAPTPTTPFWVNRFSSEQFVDEWNQNGTSGEELGGGLITQIVAVESEYILSQPQGLDFVTHKQPLSWHQHTTVLNDNSRQVTFFFPVWQALSPVFDYCSSWQLIDLSTVLKRRIVEIARAWLWIFISLNLCLTQCPALASSKAQRALRGGTMRNRMFVLLPSLGSFWELHLNPIKAAPAKLFSAVKAHESYYVIPPHHIQFCPWNRICPLPTSLNHCCPC